MRDIRRARMANRALYSGLEDDKTMDLVERMYQQDPVLARRWHLMVLENDVAVVGFIRELIGNGDSQCE